MATRNLTTPDLLDGRGRVLRRARMTAHRCDIHVFVEEQEVDSNGQATFTTIPTETDTVYHAMWGGISGKDGHHQWFPIRFMQITDGGTGASDAATARTNLGVGTGDSPQFASLELGHASDTTIARMDAGRISVEGKALTRSAAQVISASNSYIKTQADLVCDGTDD